MTSVFYHRPGRPDWDTIVSDDIPTRIQAGERVMREVCDLIEHGRSQVLTRGQLMVIKSYVDLMIFESYNSPN